MFKKNNRFFTITLLTGVFAIIITGCDIFGGTNERKDIQPQFSYEMIDENGELLKKVTHERIDESEVETSLKLFGDRFTPPSIAKNMGIDPENLRRFVVYLHAETGVEDGQTIILNFRFPYVAEQLKSGTHPVFELSVENWLHSLRIAWENSPIHQDKEDPSQNVPVNIDSFETEDQMQMITAIYHESSGFGSERRTKFLYQATGGYVELEDVLSDEHVEGSFMVDLAGVPAEILSVDEFPEDPEFRTYRITGNFVTEYGDYIDLEQVHIRFF